MVNAAALGGIWPDRVILLRVDPTTGIDRQEVVDRIGAEGIEFQARVANAFDTLVAADPERFAVIDASEPIASVVQAAIKEVERWLWTPS